MANTYHQLYIQVVFAVKYRRAMLLPEFRQKAFGYMGEIINNLGHKTLLVNGISDHVHCFFGLSPAQSLSDLMREIKANSSRWINEQGFLEERFEWQSGFGAFSYGRSQLDNVYQYVKNQEAIHQERTFRKEYLELLTRFEIEHDERYIFHDPL